MTPTKSDLQALEEKIRDAVKSPIDYVVPICKKCGEFDVKCDEEWLKEVRVLCPKCMGNCNNKRIVYKDRPLNLQDVAYFLAKNYRDQEFPDESMKGKEATHLYIYSQVPEMLALADVTKDYQWNIENNPEFSSLLVSLLLDE